MLLLASVVAGGIDLKSSTVYVKRAVAYRIQAHLANILEFLNDRIDRFIINKFLGPAALRLYAVRVRLVERVWMLSQAVSSNFFPGCSGDQGGETKRIHFSCRSHRVLDYCHKCSGINSVQPPGCAVALF